MKQMLYTVFAAVAVLSGCSKDQTMDTPSDGEIRITASIAGSASAQTTQTAGIEVSQTPPRTRGLVLNNQAQTGLVLLRKNSSSSSAPTSFAGAEYLTANRAANGTITFATTPTYTVNNYYAHFAGFYPAGSKGTDKTTWTLATGGKQDILVTNNTWNAGRWLSPVSSGMTFNHALACLQVICMADATQPLDAVQQSWGRITKIEILGTATTATYTYADRKMAFAGSGTFLLSKSDCQTDFTAVTLSTAQQLCAGGMFAPAAAGSTAPIKLKIYSEKRTAGVEVAVQLREGSTPRGFAAGMTHTATLVFDAIDVQVGSTLSVPDWTVNPTVTDDMGVYQAVNDYYYGDDGTTSPYLYPPGTKRLEGVVFWVDPDDPRHFKVVQLENSTYSKNGWGLEVSIGTGGYAGIRDGSSSGNVNSVARQNGKNNYDILERWAKYSENAIYNFSAFVGCQDYGGWHVPAMNELQYLYCAFNGAEPTTWAVNTVGAPRVNKDAQDAFNGLFTAAEYYYGGLPLDPVGNYWSSTEYSATIAWRLYFGDGTATVNSAGYKTNTAITHRCVKDIYPPAKVNDYYYSDGTTSSELIPTKTVEGIVFWVNPDDPYWFKVVYKSGTTSVWSTVPAGILGLTNSSSDVNAIERQSGSRNQAWLVEWMRTNNKTYDNFPAFKACENLGVMWTLPSLKELQQLYCTYAGVSQTNWATGHGNYGSDAKKNAFDARLRSIPGGAALANSWHFSSTSFDNNWIWGMYSRDGNTGRELAWGNSYAVRCIREVVRNS